MSSQNKKKRKGSQSKKRHNNPEIVSTNVDFRCECSDETSLIQDITVERNSHEESTVDVSSNFGLMEAQSNSNLMCLQNKKMRKRLQPKKSRDSPETVSSNVDLQVVTSKTMAAPSRVEPSVDMIIKTVSEIAPIEIEALGDTGTKTELAVSPVEVNASVNTSIQTDSIKTLNRSKKKKTKRKRCKKHRNPLEHHDPDHVLLGGNSLGETMFLGKDSSLQPSADMCSKNELVMKQPDRDICFFSGHKASVDNRVVNSEIVNGMCLEKEDLKLACKVSELHLTNLTENLLAADKQSCPSKSANRSSMEKYDGPSENDLVSSETNNMNTYKRKKVVKTYTRKERQGYYYSSVHGLDCVEKDNTRYISGDSLMNNVSVLPKGHPEQEHREKLDETHISVQVASHGDGISGKIPSDPMEDNGCGHDACCKYPERTVEVETKMADIFPSSSHLCVMRADVVLDGTGQMENPKLNLQSSPERAFIGHSKKKLLVLDVNGLLAHIVSHPSYRKPDIMVSMKAVYKRPYSDDFLRFCFERFNVGVWSSRVKKNLDPVVDCLLGDSRQNLLFCWDASHCSTTGLNTVENHRKPLVLKELQKLWEKLEPNLPWDKGEYNETNTLLLDDTPYKALCNPAYTAIFPYPYDHREANDFSLGPGGDLRVYLEGLAVAENVQEYVRQNPFGQRAVTKSHPSWNFYRKVFLVRPQPPHYDGNREIIYTKSCESNDITQSGNSPGMNHSTDGINSAHDLIHSELDVKEQSHKQQMSECESLAFAAPVLVRKGQDVVSSHEQFAFGRPVLTVCSPVSNSVDQQPLTSNLKKSAIVSVDGRSPSGTSVAAQGLDSESKSSQITKGGSPFRLLQAYASDDVSENDEDPEFVNPLKDSSSAGVESSHLRTNARLSTSLKAVNFLEGSSRDVKEIAMASISSGTSDKHVNDKHENQASVSYAESPQDFQQKHSLAVTSVEACLNGKFHKEYEEKGSKSAPNTHKVDEFGRLVREGASESDSDDSRYNRRQCRRGSSRSRSPLDRQSRRSPRRRRDKRSRSSSWSPRNRRSRSSSPRRRRDGRPPASRHAGEVSGDGMRRRKGQIPECFDFRRGRCYRGASCRYLHHDSHKDEGTNYHRSKQQYLETPLVPKNYIIHGEVNHNLPKASNQQHLDGKISEMQLGQDMADSSFDARKDMHVCQKREDSINDASQSGSFDQDSQLIASHSTRSASSREAAAERLQTHVLPQRESEMLTTVTNKKCQEAIESTRPIYDDDKSHVDASQDTLPTEDSLTKPPEQIGNSSISDSFLEQKSVASVNKLPETETLLNTTDFGHHSAQLLPPPPTLSEGGATAQHMILPLGDYDSIPQSKSFSSQSSSAEKFPSYMLPNQQSHFLSSIATWGSLPPPPPPPSVSSELQQSHLPPRNDFGSQIRQPQVGGFLQQTCPVQEPNRSNSHAEDFSLNSLPPYNLPGEQFIGPRLLKEDHSTHFPPVELSASKIKGFPADNLPPGKLLKSSSQTHPYLQQPHLPYGLHHPAPVSLTSRYPSDIQEANQSSHLPDFSGSRNSTYYNPYASTFEQHSKFGSDVFRQEDNTYNTKYASPFSMSHAQDDGRDIVSVGSRQATSSPNSAKAFDQNFPRLGGDQYDPLLDSIEPSSSLTKKIDNVQKWEPGTDSDIMLRLSSSNKLLDVEENNKKKEIGGIALAPAVDNEEYGETADVEVGAVENESPSNPIEAPNMNAGEIEIDQMQSPGKSKKSKESRSMKLFKVALADFVKEVLKPSWRQGNMSKEAFKTIVKKTVDKVSGAMKSHQIPKSQAKIDQYIASSQRKLTKLVTGYVDKYVKM